MKILIPSAIIILLFSFSGCYYDSKEFLYPELSSSCDTTNITYSGSVKPILDLCQGCHSNGSAASYGGGIKLEDYTDVKAHAIDGKLLGSIKHSGGYSPMPKGSSQLETCKITIIEKWISAGEPNN
jgi:hypothetical protein